MMLQTLIARCRLTTSDPYEIRMNEMISIAISIKMRKDRFTVDKLESLSYKSNNVQRGQIPILHSCTNPTIPFKMKAMDRSTTSPETQKTIKSMKVLYLMATFAKDKKVIKIQIFGIVSTLILFDK